MSTRLTTIVLSLIVMVGASPGVAQTRDTDEPRPLPARAFPVTLLDDAPADPAIVVQNPDELARWVHDYTDWKAWAAQWHNRREPGWFTESRQRRPQPIPPAWLVQSCDASFVVTSEMTEACALVAEWRTDSGTTNAVRAAATAAAEDGDKMTWWEHLHLDGGWPSMQSKGIYGVIGMHATTAVRGRFQIFVAPGAMLLNVPTRDGRRAWKLATSYGITYRLGEIQIPGIARALLHMNLAKAWLLGGGDAELPTKSTDFVGFSLTFKKTP